MILNQTKLLFDIANDEAKKLQAKRGDIQPKGIVSTQVQGLILAIGGMFDKLAEVGEKQARGK